MEALVAQQLLPGSAAPGSLSPLELPGHCPHWSSQVTVPTGAPPRAPAHVEKVDPYFRGALEELVFFAIPRFLWMPQRVLLSR